MPEQNLRQHNSTRWDGLTYSNYSTNTARMQSFASWPATAEQKPENLSNLASFIQVLCLIDKNSIYYKLKHFS